MDIFGPTVIAVMTLILKLVQGQIPCHDANDCPGSHFDCRGNLCICDRPLCDVAKSPGDRCIQDGDCMSTELMCYGKNELRSCRCRNRMFTYDMKFNRCLKDDAYVYDPVQNFVIPAIIVMSVGAMVYLGVKLFTTLGKMWRRRQSELSRDLETITGVAHAHQQPAWIASYRVFSQISNSGQHTLHPAPCMGLFVPSLTTSPPPYEEALKHKVILSSMPPAATTLTGVTDPPLYPYEPPQPVDNAMPQATTPARLIIAADREQSHPLRYYPGDGNPQIPAVWNSGRELTEDVENTPPGHLYERAVIVSRENRAAARPERRPRHYLRPLGATRHT